MHLEIEKDLKGFIAERCKKALMECSHYMDKERSGKCDSDELQSLAEELCYKKGFADAVSILTNK